VVEEVEGDEGSELVWRMKRGEVSFYRGGRGPRYCGEVGHGEVAAVS
jgi:hypothetical protein